ncbi:MAG: DUF5615 family PIN-like protein [bacterium]
MKLLFDQNLSYRLSNALQDVFPNSSHVSKLNMKKASDFEIWEYARQHGYVIVTQDADFFDMSLLKGFPPQIVWLRCGNQKTELIETFLRQHVDEISQFIEEESLACLEIYGS